MKQQFSSFLARWALNAFGLWVSVSLLGELGAEFSGGSVILSFLLAGLIFSLVNVILKPIIVILSLPAILLTLGLFILVVNGFMVYVALKLVPNIEMTFGAAIIAGMIMSLVNYIVTGLFDKNISRGERV